ncbi:helix-turn-helix domain-containing protein [Sanguibacteroides justesenii]|nr:helix-turn-helix transcriptional regulator [Sanguibacteroides justesenii]
MIRNKMDYDEEIHRIALNIRRIRMSRNLTIQELAYKCDIERSNMSRIEAGKSNVTVKTLCLICSALEIELSDLVGKSLEEPSGE